MWWEQADGTKGLGGQPLADLPLYGIERLDARAVVVVCEGEKAATALQDFGIPAVGTVTGAAATPGRAALAELTGRTVILWPDADEVGRAHMDRVAAGLAGIAADVRRIARADAPDHADAADYLASGLDPALLIATAEHVGLADSVAGTSDWPTPEDRGTAVLSELGTTEYVEDLVRPGRIVVWAAEEGSGKSFAVSGELAIRVAAARGLFAETWRVVMTGPVLVLSEMHSDDDFVREETVLASLGLEREALSGRYYRLPLMTAAGGKPALTVPEWRERTTAWLREHGALLLVVDTATSATQVDPWGGAIQTVYQDLRGMIAAYPTLAVILIVHCRKPSGRGDRRISDVLGEWGRWCDVVVVQENDGTSLERCRLTVRKRVRRERRIIATKRGGLLVEAADTDEAKGSKIPLAEVVATVAGQPGMTLADLGKALGVSKDTASNYVAEAEKAGRLISVAVGPRRQKHVYLAEMTAEPPNTAERASSAVDRRSGPAEDEVTAERRTEPIGSAVGSSVVQAESVSCSDYSAHQFDHFRDSSGWHCPMCTTMEEPR
jgi:DNA-binding MarR family transcriptional regulator/5S rRNA maturation endonuclease (ribonuclease M5)